MARGPVGHFQAPGPCQVVQLLGRQVLEQGSHGREPHPARADHPVECYEAAPVDHPQAQVTRDALRVVRTQAGQRGYVADQRGRDDQRPGATAAGDRLGAPGGSGYGDAVLGRDNQRAFPAGVDVAERQPAGPAQELQGFPVERADL